LLTIAATGAAAAATATLRAATGAALFPAALFTTARLATGFLTTLTTRLAASVSFFFVFVWHYFPSLKRAAAYYRD
jgi:hypothetical protein